MRRPSRHEGDGPVPLIQRRSFLKLAAAAAAGVATGACARAEQQPPGPAPLRRATAQVAERAQPGLNVFQGAGEFTTGRQRFPFGLGVGGANKPIADGQARVWVARGEQLQGPLTARFRRYAKPGAGDPTGFFATDLTIPEGDGVVDLLVEAQGRYGFVAIVPKDEQVLPTPGERAIDTRTPTVRNAAGVQKLCTRDTQCGMHEVSLHEVLGRGKPVVFTIGSPALCTSRTCGPVLEEVLAVRADHGADATFIHVEPYAGDTATTLSPTAIRWKIPSEPWVFLIDGDGRAAARFEGPVVADEIRPALAPLLR